MDIGDIGDMKFLWVTKKNEATFTSHLIPNKLTN